MIGTLHDAARRRAVGAAGAGELRIIDGFEAASAGYLDERATLRWRHRKLATTQYGLQGWQPHKVCPDAIFGRCSAQGQTCTVAMETRGLHLDGSDSADKQALLYRLTEAFRDERFTGAGTLALTGTEREDLVCEPVFDAASRGAVERRYFGGGMGVLQRSVRVRTSSVASYQRSRACRPSSRSRSQVRAPAGACVAAPFPAASRGGNAGPKRPLPQRSQASA